MSGRKKPFMTDTQFRSFKATLQAGKGCQPQSDSGAAPVIYSDALLRSLLVVDHGGQLWLVPRRPGGWASRQRLTMSAAARSERLRPAKDVDAVWLGVVEKIEPQACARMSAAGQT